jgi:hypothetical protein
LQTGTKPVPCSRVRPARLLAVHPTANAVNQNARAISNPNSCEIIIKITNWIWSFNFATNFEIMLDVQTSYYCRCRLQPKRMYQPCAQAKYHFLFPIQQLRVLSSRPLRMTNCNGRYRAYNLYFVLACALSGREGNYAYVGKL